MDIKSLKVGQIVYLRAIGNNARRGEEMRIEEWEIKTVGRKYITVWKDKRENSCIKFEIDNDYRQSMNCSANWVLYFSRQDILDEQELNELERFIRKRLSDYSRMGITLNQARGIKQILDVEFIQS